MSGFTTEQELAELGRVRAKLRTDVGTAAANLSRLKSQVEALPHDPDALADQLGIDRAEGAAALQRLQQLEAQLGARLRDLSERICLLDQALRWQNDEDMRWNYRSAGIQASIEAAASHQADHSGESPMEVFRNISLDERARIEKQAFQDAFARGWGDVTAASARFLGSMTGGTDLITVVYGIDDQGKQVGAAMRTAAFLSLAGGALLSDAMRLHHLQNIVADRAGRAARDQARAKAREVFKERTQPDVATDQKSVKPSGTIAGIEEMGIPTENFRKIQQRCFEEDAQLLLRPSGGETPYQMRQGATPKAMHHKSKTANDLDTLLGANPTGNGNCAAFEPKTDFFENAMRRAGMSDGEVGDAISALRAGEQVAAPPGFADASLWSEATGRFQFRQEEWTGPIGDAVRKRVNDGVSEIRDGIVHDLVDGKMTAVTGDHDPFELFIKGKSATPEAEAAFWQQLNADDAGIMHGGHARFDPQLRDYQPGGRFEVDTTGYSPEAAAKKIQAKFESDRAIYEVIIDKHTVQRLDDDVLRNMEGFEQPTRAQYPDTAYGELRYRQDIDLYDRWQKIQSGDEVAAAKTKGEVLVLVNPVGPPLIVRAGDIPDNFKGPIRPLAFTPAVEGWAVRLPSQLGFWGVEGMLAADVEWDPLVSDWFERFGRTSDTAAPMCLPPDDLLVVPPVKTFPWKPAAAAAILGGITIGGIAIATGGGDDEAAAPSTTVAIAVPVASVLDDPEPSSTTVAAPPPATTAPTTTVAISTGPATQFAVPVLCASVVHSPADEYPGSPSYFVLDPLLVGVDGPLAETTPLTFSTPGADVASVDILVGADGLGPGAVVPISSYGSYPVQVSIDGAPPLDTPAIEVVVTADEGPIAGCVPPRELPADEMTAIRGATVDLLTSDADAGGGGGLAVETPGAFPPPEDDLAPYREFFTRYEMAHRDGDAMFLLETLHPLAIERYGLEQCASYVESVLGSVSSMRVVAGRTEPWDFPLDGLTADVPDAFTLDIEANWGGGDAFVAEVHVARVDDDLAWFADCGDPA